MARIARKTEIEAALKETEAELANGLRDMAGRLMPATPGGKAALAGGAAAALAGVALRRNPLLAGLAGAGAAWLAVEAVQAFNARGGKEAVAKAVQRLGDEGQRVKVAAAEAWRDLAAQAQDRAVAELEALASGGQKALDAARERAAIAEDYARDLAASFRHGLEDLAASAADRIAETRARAWAALSEAGEAAEPDQGPAASLMRRHPVASAAAGLALGAGIVAATPAGRRRIARHLPDAQALMAEARILLETERENAGQTLIRAVRTTGARAAAAVEDIAHELSLALTESAEAVEVAGEEVAEAARRTTRTAAKRAANGVKAH